MEHLYGEFTQNQIAATKEALRKSIFFLLICVDKKTAEEHKEVDVDEAFSDVMNKIGGLNQLLMEQPELVTVLSLLQAALIEYHNPNFKYRVYRKLILDAGAEVGRLREV